VFVALIENTSPVPIDWPAARVTLVDAGGAALEQGPCASPLRALAPREKAPCAFAAYMVGAVVSHRVELRAVKSQRHDERVRLLVRGTLVPARGGFPYRVDGTMKNASAVAADGAWVLVGAYDVEARIIGVADAQVGGGPLPAGGEVSFSVELATLAGTPYTLSLDGIGYADRVAPNPTVNSSRASAATR
jgi:hypothetical protein